MLIGNLASWGRMALLAAVALLAGPVLSPQDVRTTEPATPSVLSLPINPKLPCTQ